MNPQARLLRTAFRSAVLALIVGAAISFGRRSAVRSTDGGAPETGDASLRSATPAASATTTAVATAPTDEGKRVDFAVVAGPFDLHRKYRSMEGPWVSRAFTVAELIASHEIALPESLVTFVEDGDPKSGGPSMNGGATGKEGKALGVVEPESCKRELLWLKRIKVETLDENGAVIPSNEFLCHLNLDVDLKGRETRFPQGEVPGSERILTFQQGLPEVVLPTGYAIPLSSDESLRFSFQAANRTTNEHRRIRLRCSISVIRDKELWYPITALSWQVPQIQVVIDGQTAAATTAMLKNCPCCKGISRGVNAPNSVANGVWTDANKQIRSGHWVVPPGTHTFTDPVLDLTPGFAVKARKVHALWAHVHPFCKEVAIVRPLPTSREKVISLTSQTRIKPIGFEIERVDFVSSVEPILVEQGGPYEVEVTYANPLVEALDSMATIGVLFEDETFVRPPWAIHDMNADACEVPIADSAKGTPAATTAALPPYPLYDAAVDGPLLTTARTVTMETTSGNLELLLDPSIAPTNVTQLCRLFAKGAYDGVEFFRHEARFVMQCTNAETKAPGYAAIPGTTFGLFRRLPLEAQAQTDGRIKHVPHVISMARELSLKDSAVTSFSILLGDAPHLDGNFTIVGRLVEDAATVATLDKMESDWLAGKHPVIVRTSVAEPPPAK